MKRNYTKPDIIFEDFSLSTNIAAGCEVKTDTQSKGDCGITYAEYSIFVEEVSGCKDRQITIEDDAKGGYNGICYHVFTDTNNVFNS